MRGLRGLLGGLAALVVLAGCGLPVQSAPQSLSTAGVPFGLLSPAATVSASAVPAPLHPRVYFIRDDRLVGVPRDSATDPVALLDDLLKGPSSFEASHRVRTAISPDTTLLSTRLSGDVLTVNLSGQFVQLRGQEQVLAFAQLVYTATSAPLVRAVRFELDGKPLQVPEGDGTLAVGAVDRTAYTQVAPVTTAAARG